MTQGSALHPLIYRRSVSPMNLELHVAFVHVGISGEVTLNQLCTLPKMVQTSVNIWLAVLLADVATSVSPFDIWI